MSTNEHQLLPIHFRRLADLGERDRVAIRWLLRSADENGIVREGIAVRFGRAWWIDAEKLPAFLAKRSAIARRQIATGSEATPML